QPSVRPTLILWNMYFRLSNRRVGRVFEAHHWLGRPVLSATSGSAFVVNDEAGLSRLLLNLQLGTARSVASEKLLKPLNRSWWPALAPEDLPVLPLNRHTDRGGHLLPEELEWAKAVGPFPLHIRWRHELEVNFDAPVTLLLDERLRSWIKAAD